ncbi:DNA recombination protein RmuC [Rhizobium wenxiniae]|uniref:DNA recombination protein RmuC homolog n=1 Tax=Rhizobium wenxiniae TaxID=1737357 RepID=A0A7X0D0W3_9HYPH|nr:DNA recombination protein RmuC [Rhizobium wenxiniae]MBB6162926.1 DNA recombination protein RmuC [Rhizobium wenxiniae]GGF94737.1 DNA recombination protein RmuC [Rhizobium wenxiniae]
MRETLADILPPDFAPPILLIGASLAVLAVMIALFAVLRGGRQREEMTQRTMDAEARLAELVRMQGEMHGRVAAMAETITSRQAELNHAVNQRLDGMTHRLGSTITEQTKSTHENLRKLQERLAVIDAAQNNIQTLAKDVVGLQAILSNKQTRGAFGQGRMETIVADGLPQGAYSFQSPLSNGTRPDCVVRMPNGAPPLVIDAKFPLEAWTAFREAASPDARRAAAQQFRRDMDVHIKDVSEKYLIAGETQDTVLLFVPSESIFAEIHEHFDAVVQKAQRSRVVIVSPSLLLLSIQVIQAVLRDQRMREQAHLIQGEVGLLMEDLTRLDDRTRKLQSHFLAAEKDVEQILTSTEKLTRRGNRITSLELETPAKAEQSADAPPPKSVESRTGLLRLRVVDED